MRRVKWRPLRLQGNRGKKDRAEKLCELICNTRTLWREGSGETKWSDIAMAIARKLDSGEYDGR